MAKDIIQSIINAFKSRTSDPFWGYYTFFLLIINYPVTIYLLSGIGAEKKVELIQIYVKDHPWELTAVPLGVALFFTTFWPWIRKKLREYLKGIEKDEYIALDKIESEKTGLDKEHQKLAIDRDNHYRLTVTLDFILEKYREGAKVEKQWIRDTILRNGDCLQAIKYFYEKKEKEATSVPDATKKIVSWMRDYFET